MGKTENRGSEICVHFLFLLFFRDYLAIKVNLEYQDMQVHLDFKLVMITPAIDTV
jgi:hypothetical protein